MDLLGRLSKAFELTEKNFDSINIERAIFLSYHCDLRDCKFCYMSTIKTGPRKGLRSIESIFAETFLVKMANWKVEFLSSGYGVYDTEKIADIVKGIASITGEPVWLNTGILEKEDLSIFGEELKGVTASIETFSEDLFCEICPSKSWDKLMNFLDIADGFGYKKGLTIILGLGEKREDLDNLFEIIKNYKVDRVTFYSLNPHKGTIFEDSVPPCSLYYLDVVSETRLNFPKLEIITGIWSDRINLVGPLLLAGSNGITKFSWQKFYGTKLGKSLTSEIREFEKISKRKFNGSMTDISLLKNQIEFPKAPTYKNEAKEEEILEKSEQIKEKINSYISGFNLAKN
ncbi:MAG: radical SAM protein [Candidatus Methanofastidiosa archaeon]|nr:radical SAM protein [Candidatus Methanofastidiosa archaeon]